jgi:hypothetical protein
VGVNRRRTSSRREPLQRSTFGVDKELCEIPFDGIAKYPRYFGSKESKQRVTFLSVHFYLGKQREGYLGIEED